MNNLKPVSAVVEDVFTEKSWVAGAGNSKIEYIDFEKKYGIKAYTYLSDTELQNRGFETWGCVGFSGEDLLECATNIKVEQKLFKPENIQWLKDKGLVKDNKANYSDRYVFIKAKIEKGRGTSGDNVAETIRKVCGLIPESMLPWGGKNWDEYADPKVITKEMENLGKEFLDRFIIQHDWVVTPQMSVDERVKRLEYYSKHLPLQIFIPICGGYNSNGTVKACYSITPEHALIYGWKQQKDHLTHDQYMPDWKKLAIDYPILWAKRYDIIDNPDFVDEEEFDKQHPELDKEVTKAEYEHRQGLFQMILNFIKKGIKWY